MGVWEAAYPQDTLQANQIHTFIQNTKVDIMERLRMYDGTDYYHLVYDSTANGRHKISTIGFVKSFNTIFELDSWIGENYPEDGCLAAVDGELYLIFDSKAELLCTNNHSNLSNLDGADHPQYMAADGSRAATGNFNLLSSDALVVSKFTTEPDSAMSGSHTFLSWYDGHGANALQQRHFGNDSIWQVDVNFLETYYVSPARFDHVISINPSTYRYGHIPRFSTGTVANYPLATYFSAAPSYIVSGIGYTSVTVRIPYVYSGGSKII